MYFYQPVYYTKYMKLKTKITFNEFVKLLYTLAYQRPILKLLVGVAVAILLWIVFYYLGIFHLPRPVIYQYITLVLIVVGQPAVLYVTIHNIYYSSNHLRETAEIELAKKKLTIAGESFYMELKWDRIFKVVEKKNWFLIYQNKLSAIIIPKKNLSKKDILELREIFTELEKIPVELLDT